MLLEFFVAKCQEQVDKGVAGEDYFHLLAEREGDDPRESWRRNPYELAALRTSKESLRCYPQIFWTKSRHQLPRPLFDRLSYQDLNQFRLWGFIRVGTTCLLWQRDVAQWLCYACRDLLPSAKSSESFFRNQMRHWVWFVLWKLTWGWLSSDWPGQVSVDSSLPCTDLAHGWEQYSGCLMDFETSF